MCGRGDVLLFLYQKYPSFSDGEETLRCGDSCSMEINLAPIFSLFYLNPLSFLLISLSACMFEPTVLLLPAWQGKNRLGSS